MITKFSQKGLTGDVEFISEAYPVVEFGNYDIPEGWENALAKPTQTGVPAQWETPNSTGFESNGEEETNLYFFHSDHLGSTNYLTDKEGVVQQSLVYMPYGEILSETKTYSNPYKFNGKELDTETGLAYYGARYYSPELSVWYGVDPLMEKYPQNGAYVFCNANPVRFVDLDGKATYSSEGENGNVQCQWFDSDKLYYVDEKGNTWKLHSPEPMLSQKNNTTEPSYDQKYGQPVIGGMGEDSKTTSEFTGPSIDGSPKYIDQYKTIKGLIDKLFGKKYDVEKHNVEPRTKSQGISSINYKS